MFSYPLFNHTLCRWHAWNLGKKSACQGFKTAWTLRYCHSTWKTLPNFPYGEKMIQLFEVVFLQEYWLQDTWFIFNLAGRKCEPSLLKSLLVGELRNICHLIKKIKGATPWYWAFLVGSIVCLIEHICEREEMGPYFGAGRWQTMLWASPVLTECLTGDKSVGWNRAGHPAPE